jgi:probable F420-dependent oxidoreductase
MRPEPSGRWLVIAFAVQAQPQDAASWAALARRAESDGFEALTVADHPGLTASPFVALAAAASATTTIRLGTYVANCGVREPVQLASDVATLDLLSNGRALLGLGAGHTPAEWTMSGRAYPVPAARVARLIETAQVVTRLLAGERVTLHGAAMRIDDAVLEAPRPHSRVPLLVGGGNRALLQFAAQTADIVAMSGLGRTLADGHRHEVRWREADVEAIVDIVREHARARPRPPRLDALVQHVELTDDRDTVADRLCGLAPGLEPASVLACPFVLIGTEAQLVDEVGAHAARWGIDRFTVRADAMAPIARVIARL